MAGKLTLSIIASAACFISTITMADNHDEDPCASLRAETEETTFFECISNMAEDLAALRPVLDGAVLAFTTECPAGWEQERRAVGRFIIGAGDDPDPKYEKWTRELDGGEIDLKDYMLLEAGGEEKHILTINEMPNHAHGGLFASNGQKWGMNDHSQSYYAGNAQIAAEGGNVPHNNMPPYIALHFCRYVATN